MAKCYYDTSVFSFFLFRGDWDNQYSPTKVDTAYTSLFCDEEIINAHMKGHFKDLGKDLPFMQITEKLLTVGAMFKRDDINQSDIRQKFLYMLGSLAQNNIDLSAEFAKYDKNDKGAIKSLDGMDWMHLSVADLLGCDTLLTADSGFAGLSKIGKHLKLENIKKIVILSSDGKLAKLGEFSV